MGHLVEARLRVRLAEVGLRPRQARVLSALNRMGECHQKALATEFDITPASMSTMCDRLVAAGLIEKLVDPEEKRAYLVRLTQEGESKVREVRKAWDDIDRMIVKAIGKDAAESLAGFAGNLRDQLGGRIPGLSESER
jgi:DNA-binding MarR family transcriptional regulator